MNTEEQQSILQTSEFAASAVTEILNAETLSSVLTMIDGEAMFGAMLGAYLVTSTQRNRKGWRRFGSLILSTGVGYLFTPMALEVAPFITSGGAAFFCALIIIPFSVKAMQWIQKTDIWEIIRRVRGGN